MVAESIGFVVERGREAVYDAEHFFDGYRAADRDYALATLRAARQAGARSLVLCDTNGGTLTDDLVRIVERHARLARADPRRRRSPGGSTPTTTRSWRWPTPSPRSQAGVRHVQATINGYGERCGNANMVSILANLALKTASRWCRPAAESSADLTELSRSWRRSPTSRPTTTSRTSAGARSPTRAASTAPRSPRSSGATSTSTRPCRQPGRLVVSELGGGRTPAPRGAAGASSSMAASSRGSCRS
jgi:2-isopropylmalate synthase